MRYVKNLRDIVCLILAVIMLPALPSKSSRCLNRKTRVPAWKIQWYNFIITVFVVIEMQQCIKHGEEHATNRP